MTAIWRAGGETGSVPTVSINQPDGISAGTNAVVVDASTARTGNALRFDGTTTATAYAKIPLFFSSSISTTNYTRLFFWVSALPTSTVRILAAYSNGGAIQVISVRLTAAGKLQLWNENSTPTQIGSDSTTTITTTTRYRLELRLTYAASNATVELRVAPEGTDSVSEALTTTATLASGASDLWLGWIAAPGTTASMWVDDLANNTGSGTFEKTWPAPSGRMRLNPVARLITRGTWTTDKNTTTEADIVAAVSNRPPVGIADTTASSTPHQIRSASSTNPDLIELECQSWGRIGVPGNVIRDTLSGTFLNVGDVATTTQRAQGFYLAGTVQTCQFNVRVVGAPTDTLVLDVLADSGNAPSGSALVTVSIPAASLSTTAAWVAWDLGSNALPLTVGTKYWLVLHRDGSLDAANYYQIQTTTDTYYDGGVTLYDGSAWGTVDQTTTLAFRAYSSTGNAVISVIYGLVCSAEAIATGTKNYTLNLTTPAVNHGTIVFGGDAGAAGTYPTNWAWTTPTLATNVQIASMAQAPHIKIAKTDGTTRVGLICAAFVAIEYTDPQQGYVAYTRTSDSAAMLAKPVVTSTVQYMTDGTEIIGASGQWWVAANTSGDVDMSTLTAVDDATFRSSYTPS